LIVGVSVSFAHVLVSSPPSRARYVEEAKAQGAHPNAIQRALEELDLFEADDDLSFEFDSIASYPTILHADGTNGFVSHK